MDKYKVNTGSAVNLSSAIESVQNFISGNITKRFMKLFKGKGTISEQTNPTNLKATFSGSAPYTTLSISAGTVVLENGETVTLTDAVLVHPLTLSTTVGATAYVLGIKYVSQGSEPVSAANGFYYDKAGGDAYTVKYTKYTDSYKFFITTYPATLDTDEYAICKFTTSSNNAAIDSDSLLDLREILKINNKLYDPTDVVLKDRDSVDDEKINGALETSTYMKSAEGRFTELHVGTDETYFSVETSVSGGHDLLNIKNVDDTILISIDSTDKKMTINGNSDDYSVDIVGKLKVSDTIESRGRYVKLMDALPENIINFRLDSITGPKIDYTVNNTELDMRPLMATNFANKASGSGANKANVTLKWGYDEIIGSLPSGSNIFTVTGGITSQSADSLVGHYLYHESLGNLRIASNTGYTLTLQDDEDPSWTGFSGTKTITSGSTAWIHANADAYYVTATPQEPGTETPHPEGSVQFIAAISESPTVQMQVLQLTPGIKYYFKIYGAKGGLKTNTVPLSDGSDPVLIRIPDITNDGTIGAISVGTGFRVTIQNWAQAENFEICYTTDNAGANFANPAHGHIITTLRSVDITTPVTANYHIKVRPLICGQQVIPTNGIPSKDVVSGSGGNLPQDQVLASTYVDFDTYSGTLSSVNSYNSGALYYFHVLTSGDALTRLSDGMKVTDLPQAVVGELLVDSNDNAYRISSLHSEGTYIYMEAVPTKTLVAPTAGAFTIGVSKDARLVWTSNKFTVDYRISRIDVDCDVLRRTGERGLTVRVYQEGKENTADYVIVSKSDAAVGSDGDTLLLGAYGDRNLRIDLVDPDDTSPYNNEHKQEAGMAGRITVYARPVIYGNEED